MLAFSISCRGMARWLPAIVLLALPFSVQAQTGTDAHHPKYLPARVFSIPFSANWSDHKLRQLKLFISANGGTTWEPHATATAPQRGFEVRVDRDGQYAFAIQTIYSNGDAEPVSPNLLRASQFVVVDTEKPTISLRPLPSKPTATPGQISVGVQWDVQDDNLDPRSLRLDVRWAGQGQWSPITDKPITAHGEDIRGIPDRLRMEVRLTARDYAGNEAAQTVMVGAGGGLTSDSGGYATTPSSTRRRGVVLLNRHDFTLEFAVREKGPSGIAGYELWMTTNRKDWKKVPAEFKSPGDTEKATVSTRVEKDDYYGFTIIARSGANLSRPQPKDGDEPQIWVEIDTKPPEAKITDVTFQMPNDNRAIVITWTAKDEHLEASPISFEYRVKDTDPWKELAYGLPNLGKHTVATPQLGSNDYQFFIRMKVVDRAANQTVVEFPKPIVIDLIRPHVEITDVMPAKQ
jgi:hypothetical protein